MPIPVSQPINSVKISYGTQCPIIGREKFGLTTCTNAVTKVPNKVTKPIMTNQCAIPVPVKLSIFECAKVS